MKMKFKRNGREFDLAAYLDELLEDGATIVQDQKGDKAEFADGKLRLTVEIPVPDSLNAIAMKPSVSGFPDRIVFRETPSNPENKICVDASGQYIFVFGGYGGQTNLGIPCKILYDVVRDIVFTKETSLSGQRDKGYYLASPDEEVKFINALKKYGLTWNVFSNKLEYDGWFPKDGEEYWYIDRDNQSPFKFGVKNSVYEASHLKRPDAPDFNWNKFKTPEEAHEAASKLSSAIKSEVTEIVGSKLNKKR